MGANDFMNMVSARSAEEAFHLARENAQYEHGHGGYTGTIAEKSDFVMIEDTWKDLKIRYSKMIKGLSDIIKWVSSSPAKQLTREQVVDALRAINLPYWIRDGKTFILEDLRKTIKNLRAERDSCKPSLPLETLAHRLLYTFNDSRVRDKWGPAGCIDMDPKLTGKRKEKRFLFFGLASS